MQAGDKGEGKECFTEGNVEIQVLCNIYYYYFPISTCLLPATSSFPLPPLGFVIEKCCLHHRMLYGNVYNNRCCNILLLILSDMNYCCYKRLS